MLRLLVLESGESGRTVAEPMPAACGQSLSFSLATPPLTIDESSSQTSSVTPKSPSSPRKRRVSHDDPCGEKHPTAKRVKSGVPTSEPVKLSPRTGEGISEDIISSAPLGRRRDPDLDLDRVRDVIQHQFGLEILCKHNELRLIDQEMAKCQIALEQLRRCHLMPYPVNIPTPEQMLDISNGTGPVVSLPSQHVPSWAPPYGVTDGPYARHYAKWLIPDPIFDGLEAEPKVAGGTPESRLRGSVPEGRSTRNSFTYSGNSTSRGRHGRSQPGPKHQALPYSYPTPRDKAGPCILKRASDGRTVKLACLDCHRENFSSTQGFINHCRIAHKRDFKSHEEAAIACGIPIDTLIGADDGKDEKPLPTTRTVTALHPFARHDMTDQETYKALRARISASMELYKQGKLPGVSQIPSWNDKSGDETVDDNDVTGFQPSQETPYLSRFLKRRKFRGNLGETVANAKLRIPLEDLSVGDDSDEAVSPPSSPDRPVRSTVMMRVPARSVKMPAPAGSATHPPSSKGCAPVSDSRPRVPLMYRRKPRGSLSDEDLDMEDATLSPGILVSNAAPSLVSDDGEYDSDEGCSVSGASDTLEGDTVSDVAEISLDYEHESRTIRRGSNGMGMSPVKLRRDDSRQVALMGTVQGGATRKRPRRP